MASETDTENPLPPLWKYVSVSEYSVPAEPVARSAQRGLALFRHLFRQSSADSDAPLKTDAELRSLPAPRLDRVAPAPLWEAAAEALEAELEGWLRQPNPEQPVVVLIGPPFGGRKEILDRWADGRNWRPVAPPSPEQILSGDDNWLSGLTGDDTPWIFPALEQAYLRHETGLALVRGFLNLACSGALGRGLVGCDSWAWAYLSRLRRGRRPATLALQGFDQVGLGRLFQESADECGGEAVRFRQSDNGQFVLLRQDDHETTESVSSFLRLLAAYSRGNVGVAHAVWRSCLLSAPDETIDENKNDAPGGMPAQTIWVTPWDQRKPPAIPEGAGRDEAFVLHALLLHDGVSVSLLDRLLPLSSERVTEIADRLEGADLVIRADGMWRVSALGYPAARRFLQANGYLVDAF